MIRFKRRYIAVLEGKTYFYPKGKICDPHEELIADILASGAGEEVTEKQSKPEKDKQFKGGKGSKEK